MFKHISYTATALVLFAGAAFAGPQEGSFQVTGTVASVCSVTFGTAITLGTIALDTDVPFTLATAGSCNVGATITVDSTGLKADHIAVAPAGFTTALDLCVYGDGAVFNNSMCSYKGVSTFNNHGYFNLTGAAMGKVRVVNMSNSGKAPVGDTYNGNVTITLTPAS